MQLVYQWIDKYRNISNTRLYTKFTSNDKSSEN